MSKTLDEKVQKKENEKRKPLAHREDRTRSLQMPSLDFRLKSLTLYPIELGGRRNLLLNEHLISPKALSSNINMQNIP